MNSNLTSLPLGETRQCEECGEQAVRGFFTEQVFPYGLGADAVQLSARVPVWTCSSCGHAYTDGDAEEFRHEAVCRHLGVLTPAQIRSIRASCGMRQAEFAKLTGFGLASVKRWETGVLVQNQSADRILRLIKNHPETLTNLLSLDAEPVFRNTVPKFRTAFDRSTEEAARVFVLRRLSA